MSENLGIGYVGIKGMKYGAVPPMPKEELKPIWPDKIEIVRWQRNTLIELLARTAKTLDEWRMKLAFIDAHFEVQKLEPKGGEDIKNVYVFFGYKQDATHYRLEHDIKPEDMVLARNYDRLRDMRARPISVHEDSEWYWLNWDHKISIEARYEMAVLEAKYGSAVED